MARLALVLVAAELVLWNIFTPIFESADESTYYQHVYFLAHEKRLPNLNFPPEQGGVMSYPPTYYLPLIPILLVFDAPSIYDLASIQLRSNHRSGLRYTNFNFFIHSSRELKWRWNRQEWAVHLMRLVANGWGVGTIILVYMAAKQLFKGEKQAIGASLWVGFNPMFAHLNSTITVINLLIFLASLMWYWILKWRDRFDWKRSFILGGVVGLATITKTTGLLLLPIVVTRLLLTKENRIRNLLVLVLSFSLVSGWWFIRNIALYGSLLDTDKVVATTGTRAFMAQQMGLINYWVGFFTSQWATFWTGYGWSTVYFPKIILGVLFVSIVLAGWGVAKSDKKELRWLIGGIVFWLAMLIVVHARFPAFHAKDFYPMIIPTSILVITGWNYLWWTWKLPKLGKYGIIYAVVVLFLINVTYLLLDVSPKLFGRQSF